MSRQTSADVLAIAFLALLAFAWLVGLGVVR